jgi:hypothetical protein
VAEPTDEQPAGHPGFRYIAVGRWAGMTSEEIEAEIQHAEEDTTDPSAPVRSRR